MSLSRPAHIRIHLQALQHNLQQVKKAAPQAKTMPALKANAYGHGLVATAKTLADIADGFMLACLAEALALRDVHITQPLMVIQGAQSDADLQLALEKNIRLVIHDETQLKRLANFKPASQSKHKQRLTITLKLDTGMHRLGLAPEKIQFIYQQLKRHPVIHPDIWLMSHFACADEPDNAMTSEQINCFEHYTAALNAPKTLANSAGILAWPASHYDWVRPGIMLYGSSPINTIDRQVYDLQTTMTLSAPLIAIHTLKKGDAVGYGATWICPEDTRVGVVACGYADGYPRSIVPMTSVWFNDRFHQIVGRVSMDVIIINLEDTRATIGEQVELWGQHVTIDDLATRAQTISYELLCRAGNSCRSVIEP
ncbi:MAG TPA: alanine racemase [Thiothrix sp.]|nr:alanine racemase [Thiothrix sp.]